VDQVISADRVEWEKEALGVLAIEIELVVDGHVIEPVEGLLSRELSRAGWGLSRY
jgi:hypothetical protein